MSRALRAAASTVAVPLLFLLSLVTTPVPARAQKPAKPAPAAKPPAPPQPAPSGVLPIVRKAWKGDFDAMVKRRVIRVIVPHSKTSYFVERGQPRGIVYDAFKAFEDEINKNRGNLKVNVVFFPTSREKLVPDLLAGLGDIIAAGFTITPERDKTRRFRDAVDDQAGQRGRRDRTAIAAAGVAQRSRRQGSLRPQVVELLGASRATQRPIQEGRQSGDRRFVRRPRIWKTKTSSRCSTPASLASPSSTTTSWISGRRCFPKIMVRPDLAVSTGGELAWAFRPNSPQLKTRARRVPEDTSPGHDIRQHAAEALPRQHEIRRERAIARGDQEVSRQSSTCSGSTPASTTSTSC